ncbi:MAG: CBS domain-containing protein [Candidatus Nitrosocosmicus sp.]|nr:CBS domain-containing protein [Candidatus Nitrosocosmicus sp.]
MYTDLEAARENATITKIGTRLILRSINGLPIIEENGKVIGILTIIDILRTAKEDRDLDILKAKDLMTTNPKTVNQQTDMIEIIKLMDSEVIAMVLVVDKGNDNRLIGVVSRKDILEEKFNERFVTLGMKKTINRTLG